MSGGLDAVVRARIDKKVKKSADTVLKQIGLTPSSAFRMMMTRIASERKLPFAPLEPTAETVAAIKASRAGKGKRFRTVGALMKDLKSK